MQISETGAAQYADGKAVVPEPAITRNPDGSYTLTATTIVNQPLERVFEFFADAENLDLITPSWLRFRITSPTPVKIGEGTLIDYALRLHNFPIHWRSRIENWVPNERFTDVQVKGPYRSWRHEHRFSALGPDRTLVEDEVNYRVPGGRLAHRLLVRRDLKRIFSHRQDTLEQIFESDADQAKR